MPVAFGCRAGFDTDSFGVIAGPGGNAYDLRSQLEEGDGVVVVPDEDTGLIAILDEHPALKRTSYAKAKEQTERKMTSETSEKRSSKET